MPRAAAGRTPRNAPTVSPLNVAGGSDDGRWRGIDTLAATYVVLWLTEGAARKWFVTGGASVLYLLRDAVLLLGAALLWTGAARLRRAPAFVSISCWMFCVFAGIQMLL